MKRKGAVHQHRAQRPATSRRERLLHRVLLSLPVQVLALDQRGKVIYVSPGSRAAMTSGAVPVGPVETGSCYFAALRQAAEKGDELAGQISAALAAVLRRERSHFSLEYSRELAGETHRFSFRVDEINSPPGGAVVSHLDTTERSRTEEALRQVHDRYAFATVAGGVGLWDLDVRTRDLYIDPSLIELLGFDRAAVGTTRVEWTALTTAEDRAALRAAMMRCLRGEALDFEIEHRLINRSGRALWFLTRGNVVLASDGRPARLVGLSTEISARKEAELGIEREREKYLQIFDSAGVAIWEADYSVVARWLRRLRRRGVIDLAAYLRQSPQLVGRAFAAVRVRDVNKEAVRLSGAASRDQLLARPLHELVIDGDRQFRHPLVALWARRPICECQAALRTLAGERRDIFTICRFPAAPEQGESVLLCVQDVTELLERRRRYEMATAAGGVTVLELDLVTREFRSDPPLQTVLGLDLQHPATLQDLIDRIHPEDLPRVLGTERAFQADDAPRDEQGNSPIPEFDFRLIDARGGWRWFLKRGSVIRGPDGRATKMIGTITDITSQIRLDEKVRRSHEQVRELARRLIEAQEHEQSRIARDLHGGLSERMAHVVSGLVDLESLLNGQSESVHRGIRRLKSDIDGLVEGIQTLSRQMHPGTIERTNLKPSLRQLCAEFARLHGVEVSFAFEGDEDSTPAEIATSLYRVTQEALRNVAQHSGTKKAEIVVQLSARSIQLRIRDWGSGFHSPVGPPAGLGLLAIQERARLVGGEAYVLSLPGRGTEIRVKVPLPGA